jgi:hypothetical protein
MSIPVIPHPLFLKSLNLGHIVFTCAEVPMSVQLYFTCFSTFERYDTVPASLNFFIHVPVASVADPGCLSRIRIFLSRIQGKKFPEPGFESTLTRKYRPGCSSRIRMIRILIFLPIPDPESSDQRGSRIRNPACSYYTN